MAAEFDPVCSKQQGFTLVELVMVITILGILSVVATPNLFSTDIFKERAFFDDVLNGIRYAQQLAVATNCGVEVTIGSNAYAIERRKAAGNKGGCPDSNDTVFNLGVLRPGSGETTYTGSESGMTLTSTENNIIFNALGDANVDAVITVNGNRTITVVAVTGYVYDSTP